MINLDFIGLFLLIAGFVIGLGAATVIDIHGFLGRKSKYWTEATTRTHKVTKPMIWSGLVTAVVGAIIFFRNEPFSGIPMYLAIIAIVLIINGFFLSFFVSPYILKKEKEGRSGEILNKSWQDKIFVSLILSSLGWWSSLVLVAWYLINNN
jgi:hypothetical protein